MNTTTTPPRVHKFDAAPTPGEDHLLPAEKLITGHAVTVAAGDSFVIPRGFVGTWEVVEPTRKRLVIYDRGA